MRYFNWNRETVDPSNPFDLDDDQVAQLDRLRNLPGWRIFTRLIRDVAELNADYLLRARDAGETRDRLGFIRALHDVHDLVPLIVETARRTEDERRRHEEREGNGDGRATFGGPWHGLGR